MKQGKKFLKFRLEDGTKVKAIKIGKTDTATKYMLYNCLGPEHVMNDKDINKGGFGASDMCEYLNSELINLFKDKMIDLMQQDKNGNLLVLPSKTEIQNLSDWRDRIALDEDGESTWYWLRDVAYSTHPGMSTTAFASVDTSGRCDNNLASTRFGVRSAFYLRKRE